MIAKHHAVFKIMITKTSHHCLVIDHMSLECIINNKSSDNKHTKNFWNVENSE